MSFQDPETHLDRQGVLKNVVLGIKNSDDVASRLQVSDLYKSDLQVSSQFANDLKWKEVKVFANKQGEFIIFGLENFTSVFQK